MPPLLSLPEKERSEFLLLLKNEEHPPHTLHPPCPHRVLPPSIPVPEEAGDGLATSKTTMA